MTDVGRDEALQHLEQELLVLVRRARRGVRDRAAEVHPGLQSGAYLMLSQIIRHGPLRATGLCEMFDMDKAAVSRQVQQLVELGLVDRTPDPEDGRATQIGATEDGRRRVEEVRERRRKGFDERLAGWSAAELEDLADHLARFNQALGRPPG